MCAPSRGEGRGAILDGTPSGNGLQSVPERICTGPLEQLKPFHVTWVHPQRRSAGALQITREAPAAPSMPYTLEYQIGSVVLQPEVVDTQTASQGTPTERLHIQVDVAAL